VISVDAGTRAFAAAESARRAGVDLIITDHHLPGPEGLPHAFAVVNPNQPGCDYPSKSLCGAGIAFKVAQALMERRLPHRDQATLLLSFMKIAAIATIADSVPLVGENRVIASLGLNALRKAVNLGLKALLEVAELGGKGLSSGEVAFRIAPRINAAGRMDVAADVIELFSTKDPTQAHQIAARLDKLNSERQEEEKRILVAIEQRIADEAGLRDSYCMVIDGDGWHRGVIGITATRIVERYGRPTLIVSRDDDDAHGSGRSIPAFHLLNALESCAPLFSRFGGHAYAVGFSLRSCNVSELRSQLDTYARTQLSLADFEPTLNVDAELPLDAITPDLFETIRKLEPFGAGNPAPAFCATARLSAPVKAVAEKHVRMKLAPGAINGAANGWRRALVHNAVGWRLAERVAEAKLLAGDMLDVAFTLEQNEHAEFGGIELVLRDFETRAIDTSTANASQATATS
jgi:single-stranded-DNA-specific exonuclease